MIIKKERYILLSKSIPIISNNKITYDPNVGGEKLVYKKQIVHYKIFTLFGKRVEIPIKANSPANVTFTKPFKTYWDKRANRVSHNLWGKVGHPLTRFWCKMSGNYDCIKGDYIKNKIKRVQMYRSQRVIKILDSHPKKFTIEIGIL